jgi:putative aldouronate transport system substrate-binding protein
MWWLTLWVAISLTSLILGACGDAASTSAPASGSGATTAAGNAQPASGAPVDLTIWLQPAVSESQPPPADWEGYKIIRDKLNINLKYTALPGANTDADTKLNAAAAANNLPDIWGSGNLDLFFKWQQQGLLGSVNNLLPMMPERTKLRYSNPDVNKVYTVNGQMYALPDVNPFPKPEGLLIRKDWLDKLGLKAPTTLDELFDVAKAFTEKDPDGDGKNDTYGLSSYYDGSYGLGSRFNFIFGAYGVAGTWNLNADKFGLNVRDPNTQKALDYIKKLNDAKVIDPDWPTMKKDDFRARWKQGKYGIMWEQFCAFACQYNYSAFDTNFPNGQWEVLPAPKGPEGKSAYNTYIETTTALLVSKKALDAGKGPAIAKFLEWVNSGEGYYLLGFGKEGVNYKLDASGNVTTEGVPAPYTAKEQQPLQQLRNLAYNGTPAESKLRTPAWKTQNGRTIDPLQIYDEFGKQPWINYTSTVLIKPSPNQVDLNRYVSENMVQFALGQKPLTGESWQQFVGGLDGMGAKDWEASAKKDLQNGGFLK